MDLSVIIFWPAFNDMQLIAAAAALKQNCIEIFSSVSVCCSWLCVNVACWPNKLVKSHDATLFFSGYYYEVVVVGICACSLSCVCCCFSEKYLNCTCCYGRICCHENWGFTWCLAFVLMLLLLLLLAAVVGFYSSAVSFLLALFGLNPVFVVVVVAVCMPYRFSFRLVLCVIHQYNMWRLSGQCEPSQKTF